ncbi:MAG: hypothetical protein HN931_09615 [Desulfobacterales bacterium]|nr:hypothetical protein [Desulfobacterales bacterium]
MNRNDEISSTDKLLNIIRGNNESDDIESHNIKSGQTVKNISTSPIQQKRNLMSFPKTKFSMKKALTVGAVIGYSDLTLVMTSRSLDNKIELIDYSKVPFEPGIGKDDRQFPAFLKKSLKTFCDSYGSVEIWSTMLSARVETRYITIPKVSANQVANAVYWTYKKKVPFSDNDVIFDYTTLGNIVEDGVNKIEVVAYISPKKEVNGLNDIFLKSGYPLTGISIVPFALQNLLQTDWLKTDIETVCSLYIGKDWSRIDIFSKGNLILSRDIKTGMNSMIEVIRTELKQNHTEIFFSGDLPESDFIQDGTDELPIDEVIAKNIFFSLINNSSYIDEFEDKINITREDISRIILPVIERLTRQVERTIEHYALNFIGKRVGKIYISGETSNFQYLINYIGEQLGLPHDTIDPFTETDHPTNCTSCPDSISDRDSFTPAMGMALSDISLTPNFIFTYKEKGALAKVRNINKIMMVAFTVLLTICFGFTFLQNKNISQKEARIIQLKQDMSGFGLLADKKMIQRLLSKTTKNNTSIKESARKYLGMAIIKELSALTPDNIHLVKVSADFGKGNSKSKKEEKTLIVEGKVFESNGSKESTLAVYLVKLEESPIFRDLRINKKLVEIFGNEEVLSFKVRLKLV